MDKGSNLSNHQRDSYLKHLNKLSQKIFKPVRRPPANTSLPLPSDTHQQYPQNHLHQPQQIQNQNNLQQQHHSENLNQPPVYNINKSDFRAVVQKLTGATNTDPNPHPSGFNSPSLILPPHPRPQQSSSTRLQRIRPPPLAQLSTRPPPPLTYAAAAAAPPQPPLPATTTASPRWVSTLSSLPPFPSVHAAAESPISAYMRYLRGSPAKTPGSPSTSGVGTSTTSSGMGFSQFYVPSSPLAFGKIGGSPKSYPYPLMSSPKQVGVLKSPRWKDVQK